MFLCNINKNYPKLSPNTASYLELCLIQICLSIHAVRSASFLLLSPLDHEKRYFQQPRPRYV